MIINRHGKVQWRIDAIFILWWHARAVAMSSRPYTQSFPNRMLSLKIPPCRPGPGASATGIVEAAQQPRTIGMLLDSSVSAIVTGGASGLGRATAEALAAKGVKVAIFDLNDDLGEALAAEIGGVFCKVDVTSEAAVDAGFVKARAAHGQERVLINCAGIANAIKTASRAKETGEIKHFPAGAFEGVVQVNLIGSFRCIARSSAGMLTLDPQADGDRGAIVCTASVAAEDGQIGQAAYSASKGGVVAMTLPIARDLMGENIRINTILPGLFETPLLHSLPDHVKAALAASVPYPKRLGRPAEYAALALHLIENGYFNGESIRLDGAIRMTPR
jgi:NAD(P)-dependent dehydrogenase (short-subunit alcohol dehydrogenase family)